MEVASAAVGIVSLALQVCQGLLTYYDSWKDYDDEVAATRRSLESLQKIFIQLKATLDRHVFAADVRALVEQSVSSCDEGVGRLRKKLLKVQKTTSLTGLRGQMQARALRALYPFRETTLAKLRQIVGELKANLSHATDILHM